MRFLGRHCSKGSDATGPTCLALLRWMSFADLAGEESADTPRRGTLRRVAFRGPELSVPGERMGS